MSQKDVFLASEGNQYYRRNKDKYAGPGSKPENDRVLASLRTLEVRPSAILEIGCGHGWRLERLRASYGATCVGIDPSAEAIAEGAAAFPAISLQQGTADELTFGDRTFDLVIFGFCLYLCDRDHLFRIAAEADRVLRDPGHLAIEDFDPPFPYASRYRHNSAITTYKMNYANLFTGNPAYTLVSTIAFDHDGRPGVIEPDNRVSVSVLVKSTQRAYPANPFTTP